MRLGRGRKTAKHKAIQYYDVERSWPVEWMCKSLEVSRSGYYKWLKHEKTDEEKENEAMNHFIESVGGKDLLNAITDKNIAYFDYLLLATLITFIHLGYKEDKAEEKAKETLDKLMSGQLKKN